MADMVLRVEIDAIPTIGEYRLRSEKIGAVVGRDARDVFLRSALGALLAGEAQTCDAVRRIHASRERFGIWAADDHSQANKGGVSFAILLNERK